MTYWAEYSTTKDINRISFKARIGHHIAYPLPYLESFSLAVANPSYRQPHARPNKCPPIPVTHLDHYPCLCPLSSPSLLQPHNPQPPPSLLSTRIPSPYLPKESPSHPHTEPPPALPFHHPLSLTLDLSPFSLSLSTPPAQSTQLNPKPHPQPPSIPSSPQQQPQTQQRSVFPTPALR